MKTPLIFNRQKENIFFFLILVFSAFLYVFNINFSDLWIDETFTKALVDHSFGDMMGLIKNDFHPPLYFYGLKVFVSIFGLSAFTIRIFSVLGVLSSIVLGYTAGQRVFGKSGALYFCLLISSLPMLASYSQNARMYTWGAFAVLGVFFYAVLFIQANRKSDLILLMLFSQPILYPRYFTIIVILILVPPALFFSTVKNNWVKGGLITVLLVCGIYVSIGASYFSYGPYKQSVEYIHKTYPEIKKVFHIIEITAGPFVEYGNPDDENYWFKPKNTIVFTNMDVFRNLHTTDSLGKVLQKDETFCVTNPLNLGIILNEHNLKSILSSSQLLKVDTVVDHKVMNNPIIFLLYILKYQGGQSDPAADLPMH